MILSSTIKMGLKNLRAQKMRSFLTMLGIIIGITSIIVINSAIAGAESLITNQFSSIGPNIVGILPGGSEDEGPPAAVMGIVITSLKDEDTEAIRKLPHVEAASSYVSSTETISWTNQKTTGSIYGVSPEFPKISDTKIESGGFFNIDDEKGYANVAVIGKQIKDELFGNFADPLGQKIKIKKGKYLIIGVMEEQGTSGFVNMDNTVLVPVTTAQKKILGINHLGFIRAKVDKKENISRTVKDIEYLLRDRHNIDKKEGDDFTVTAVQDALQALTMITTALQFFLVAIVSIALIVGGIGIMNIMLASVTERIKEIGLRKAVGAKKKHIVYQFLVETIFLSFLGAIIGIVLGSLISLIIAKIVNYLGYDWNLVITAGSIITSCLFAFVIGLAFGLYPAKKAAKFDPIEALRYE